MSDKSGHDTHGATTIHASKGGGGGKWLMAGLAAVILAGGGYYAWKNYGPSQTSAQSAYNDPYATEESSRASPLPGQENLTADTASTDESDVAPAATSSTRSSTTSAARSSASTRTAEVPEETIGVTPVSATSDDGVTNSDEIVVTGPRRSIWVRQPSARRLASFYPARALERGREGEALLHCTVVADGSLNCSRASETPGGFGSAAMRVAGSLRHTQTLADGSDATGTPVNLRVVFRMADGTQRG